MAKVFSEFSDVSDTRKAADDCMVAARAIVGDSSATEEEGMHAALNAWDAMRLEIRAAAQTISSSIGAAVEEWRGEMRNQR